MRVLLRCLLSVTLIGLLPGCVAHSRPGSATLPPRNRPIRIMALGDSITRGSGSGYGNYRRPLQALLARSGYRFRFVGGSTEQSFNYHGSDPSRRLARTSRATKAMEGSASTRSRQTCPVETMGECPTQD